MREGSLQQRHAQCAMCNHTRRFAWPRAWLAPRKILVGMEGF
jgi:hypothetical protein